MSQTKQGRRIRQRREREGESEQANLNGLYWPPSHGRSNDGQSDPPQGSRYDIPFLRDFGKARLSGYSEEILDWQHLIHKIWQI